MWTPPLHFCNVFYKAIFCLYFLSSVQINFKGRCLNIFSTGLYICLFVQNKYLPFARNCSEWNTTFTHLKASTYCRFSSTGAPELYCFCITLKIIFRQMFFLYFCNLTWQIVCNLVEYLQGIVKDETWLSHLSKLPPIAGLVPHEKQPAWWLYLWPCLFAFTTYYC